MSTGHISFLVRLQGMQKSHGSVRRSAVRQLAGQFSRVWGAPQASKWVPCGNTGSEYAGYLGPMMAGCCSNFPCLRWATFVSEGKSLNRVHGWGCSS